MMHKYFLTILILLTSLFSHAQLKSPVQKAEAVDGNIQSPESMIRQSLYGNSFLKSEEGKESASGSLTSQAYMKRWNRKNEQLAMAVEPVAVMADWLGGVKYPAGSINTAWQFVLGCQKRDIMAGIGSPKTYENAWNDEILALNKFSAMLEGSAGVVIRALDTRGFGKSLMVYNPLAISRQDLVEAEISYPEGAPKSIVVVNPDYDTIPVQIIQATKTTIRFVFMASVPSLGFSCYDIQPASEPGKYRTGLSSAVGKLDNEFLKVTVNSEGNISSIIDKRLGKELLSAPSRLEFQREHPAQWPALNMDWNDRKKPPVDSVKGPASITLIEKGPLRATLRVERSARNSVFVQYITLVAGKETVVVKNNVQWQSRGVSLKASFPLTAGNDKVTCNVGTGTIESETNHEKKYEILSHEWIDLTDKSGRFGVTIIEDSKFGSDKPNANTLRLTLLYTPETNSFHDQATQDWGIHEFTYGIYSHKGDWRAGLSAWQGRSLNQPLVAFLASQHGGSLGRQFSFATVSAPQVDIRALKKAENGKDIIIRLQELTGKDQADVAVSFPVKIIRAWEVDGKEKMVGEAPLKNGKLSLAMSPFSTRSFAIQLEPPADKMAESSSFELPLIFDQDVVSNELNRKNGAFEKGKKSFPAAQFPATLTVNGIQFNLGSTADGKNNAMACKGQKIILPKTGNFNHAYILAASLTDTAGVFKVGNIKTTLQIQQYDGMIGQFDNRTWDLSGRITGLERGFIKRHEVAWHCTYLHYDTISLPNNYGYIYLYKLDASPTSGVIQLPENESIKIFAITVADNPYDHLKLTSPLYDDFSNRPGMVLNLPKSYVSENMKPLVRIEFDVQKELGSFPAKLTMKDYADMHQPNGVLANYSCDTLTGWTDPVRIGSINDGMFELLPDDSIRDKWTSVGQGRIIMDLQREIEIDSLHVFGVQNLKRGSRSFSIWMSPAENPEIKGDPVASGWKFVAYAKPEELLGNNKTLYRIFPLKDRKMQCRHIMFVSEDSPHGPYYFQEIDVFEKQN